MKKFKLHLEKETLESLNVSELKNIKAGNGARMDNSRDANLFESRLLCLSLMEYDCRHSKSCKGIVCIPF